MLSALWIGDRTIFWQMRTPARVHGNALATAVDFHRARRGASLDLFSDEAMGYQIQNFISRAENVVIRKRYAPHPSELSDSSIHHLLTQSSLLRQQMIPENGEYTSQLNMLGLTNSAQ
ncbi:MAG: hypothetical protein RR842_06825 [Gordonibacter sp.]|uniref:hypothetical protein n=1 Tax=Gordonibacter sp. TaxID=1968902 RepID=UPI002FC70BE2